MRKQWVYLECVYKSDFPCFGIVWTFRVRTEPEEARVFYTMGRTLWIFWNSYSIIMELQLHGIIMKTESTCLSTEVRVLWNHPIHRLRDQFCLACLEFWEIESILSTVSTCNDVGRKKIKTSKANDGPAGWWNIQHWLYPYYYYMYVLLDYLRITHYSF